MSDPVVIKPAWQSTKPDDPTRPDLLAPSAWNAARVLSGGNPGDLVTRDLTAPTGAIWAPAPSASSAFERLAVTTTPVNLPSSGPAGVQIDLWTHVLPPSHLGTDGGVIRIQAWGEMTAGTGTGARSVCVTLGSSQIGNQYLYSPSPGLAYWTLVATIVRASATLQRTELTGYIHTAGGVTFQSDAAEDLTTALTIRIRGIVSDSPWSDGGIQLRTGIITQY